MLALDCIQQACNSSPLVWHNESMQIHVQNIWLIGLLDNREVLAVSEFLHDDLNIWHVTSDAVQPMA